jgi:uncharacterized membrane protein YgcG
MLKKIYQKFSFIAFLFLFSVNCKFWTPEELSNEVKSWNSLNDPESLISDKKLPGKINSNYLTTNKIYKKVDVNFFIVSNVSDDNLKSFSTNLMNSLENNISINSENRKSSYLTILIVTEINSIHLLPSEKVTKLLPNEQIKKIISELIPELKNKNYAKAIIFLFEKLNVLWKKYKNVEKEKKKNQSHSYTNKEILSRVNSVNSVQIFIISSLLILVLVVSFYSKMKYNQSRAKNFGKIIDAKDCSICLEKIIKKGDKENYFTLEEITISNLDKTKYIAIMKCGHIFHGVCISEWVKVCEEQWNYETKCPLCRQSDLRRLESVELTRRQSSMEAEPEISREQSGEDLNEETETQRNLRIFNQLLNIVRRSSSGRIPQEGVNSHPHQE